MLKRFIVHDYDDKYRLYYYNNFNKDGSPKIYYSLVDSYPNYCVTDNNWKGYTLEDLIDTLPVHVKVIIDEDEIQKILTMRELVS